MIMKNMTFKELIEMGKKGNKEAINEMNLRVEMSKENNEYFLDILNACEGLIVKFASQYRRICQTYEMEDLKSLGTIGVYNAIQKYDPSYNVLFTTLAYNEIRNSISSITRKEWSKNNIYVMSLGNDDNEDGTLMTLDMISDDVDIFKEVSTKMEYEEVLQAINELTELQKAVITSLYIDELTISETAQKLNISYKSVDKARGLAIKSLRYKLQHKFGRLVKNI